MERMIREEERSRGEDEREGRGGGEERMAFWLQQVLSRPASCVVMETAWRNP